MRLDYTRYIGCEAYLRDRNIGNLLNIKGRIVGSTRSGKLFIKLENGMNAGQVIRYDYWELFIVDNEEELL